MVATSRHDTAFNEVNITTYVASEEEESTWGFNVGADVGVFVTDYIGVGGGVIISPGTVGEDKKRGGEPLTMGDAPAELLADIAEAARTIGTLLPTLNARPSRDAPPSKCQVTAAGG